MQILKCVVRILICINVLIFFNCSSAMAQSDLPGLEDGDFVPLLVVGGAALLTPVFIPNPKPDIHVKSSEMHDFLINMNETSKQTPFMLKPVNGKKQFGQITSFKDNYLTLHDYESSDSRQLPLQFVQEIMDLKSAAKRGKVSRMENAIRWGLLGIMSFQAASILDDEGSSTAATLTQLSGALWFGGSMFSIAIKSQEEKEYEKWQYSAGEEPPVTEVISGKNSNPPQVYRSGSVATGEGAILVSGAFSYSSQGGDLYANFNDDRFTTIALVPSVFYFVSPGLGVGGDLSYTRTSQGSSSLTAWGIGPKAGYFFDSGGNLIPFASGGLNLLSVGDRDDSENGFRIKFGGGVLLRKDHLGITIEAGYVIDRFKFEGAEKSTIGNTLALGVGFVGLLY